MWYSMRTLIFNMTSMASSVVVRNAYVYQVVAGTGIELMSIFKMILMELCVFLFAALINQVVEVFHEGDMIWVHGFHLAILPAFLDRTVKVREIQCLCIVYRFTK